MSTNQNSQNGESFEPGEPKIQMAVRTSDQASALTGQLLRAMGWQDFDDLLNRMEGVDKGRQIHILTTGSAS